MNEYTKLIYKLEDVFALGNSLPVVALRQLPALADKFMELPDIDEYVPETQKTIAYSIKSFYDKNRRLMGDERALLEAFSEASKLHHYSRFLLRLFKRP